MKSTSTAILVLFLTVLIAGINPVVSQDNAFTKSLPHIHALVIGISDYAHIDDLQFADRDALAFKQYLLETIGHPSDSGNINILLNEEATSPAIYAALENLVAMVEEGDKAYIYFSGHGDSENATIFQSGFLLTHDTPKSSYYTNSINVSILDNFINTLSIKNKADVILIADACRSGQIGMNDGGGTVQTAKALASNVADEVRLLSCQPEEISLESELWGDGRGLFSYHLINGLYGMADLASNGDGKVILNELGIYLGIHVPRDAEPVKQYPGIYGPMSKEISRVNPEMMTRLAGNSLPLNEMTLSPSGSKGYEDQFLAALSEDQQRYFTQLKLAMNEGRLRLPGDNSAIHYYDLLTGSDVDATFDALLRRNLAAELQKEAQRFIHVLTNVNKRWNAKEIKYGKWSEDILQSARLLGEDHFMHANLMGKHYFFDAANNYRKAKTSDSKAQANVLVARSLEMIDSAIAQDPLVAYYHNLKGVALTLDGKYEEAVAALDEAIRINPHYPYPYSNKGYALMKKGRYEEAIPHLDACIALDRAYTTAWQYKISALKKLGRQEEAMATYRLMLESAPVKGM